MKKSYVFVVIFIFLLIGCNKNLSDEEKLLSNFIVVKSFILVEQAVRNKTMKNL